MFVFERLFSLGPVAWQYHDYDLKLRNTQIGMKNTGQCSMNWWQWWWLQRPSGHSWSQSESGKNENPKMLRLQPPDSNSPSHDDRPKRTSYRPPFIPVGMMKGKTCSCWYFWLSDNLRWRSTIQGENFDGWKQLHSYLPPLPELKASQKGSATIPDDFERTVFAPMHDFAFLRKSMLT